MCLCVSVSFFLDFSVSLFLCVSALFCTWACVSMCFLLLCVRLRVLMSLYLCVFVCLCHYVSVLLCLYISVSLCLCVAVSLSVCLYSFARLSVRLSFCPCLSVFFCVSLCRSLSLYLFLRLLLCPRRPLCLLLSLCRWYPSRRVWPGHLSNSPCENVRLARSSHLQITFCHSSHAKCKQTRSVTAACDPNEFSRSIIKPKPLITHTTNSCMAPSGIKRMNYAHVNCSIAKTSAQCTASQLTFTKRRRKFCASYRSAHAPAGWHELKQNMRLSERVTVRTAKTELITGDLLPHDAMCATLKEPQIALASLHRPL